MVCLIFIANSLYFDNSSVSQETTKAIMYLSILKATIMMAAIYFLPSFAVACFHRRKNAHLLQL